MFKFAIGQTVKYKTIDIDEIGVIHERSEYVDINHRKKSLGNEIKRIYGVYGKHGMASLFENELSEV